MLQNSMAHDKVRNVADQVGFATTTMIALAWVMILLASGTMIPRSSLIGAALAIPVALCAYRAIRANEVIALAIVVPFGAVIPPELGAAPAALKFVGFLSFGYVVAAILLITSTRLSRHVGY